MKLWQTLSLITCLWPHAAPAQTAQDMIETPMLVEAVAAGRLAPVSQRIPLHPRITDPLLIGREVGRHGGMLKMLIGDQRDLRIMTNYAYTRLLTYDDKMTITPDILESYDVSEGRIFTLHLRPGHKWSDGKPFTSEDFRYFWEDVLNNKRLYADGLPPQLLINGKGPKFEVLDETTVRYTWDSVNPVFVPAMAAAQPLYLAVPSHYMRQFHERYADKTALAAAVKEIKVKDWTALHERKSRAVRQENPDLPTLDAWHNTTKPPSEYFLFERNPFYHRIDVQGHQLPYIDKVRLQIATSQLIPAKAGSGESDLQAAGVRFDSYTFLKEAEKRSNFRVLLWNRGEGAFSALFPNLNVKDEVWRTLLRDIRFRHALSLAVDRDDINRVVFFGLAHPSAATVIPQSPLYRPELEKAWTQYDPDKANALLDDMGLTQRDMDGYRLLPDGRRAEFTVESAGETTDETDILELIADDYRKIGLRLLSHSSQRVLFRQRVNAGETVMSISQAMDNSILTPDMEPTSMAPSEGSQLNWPLWGLFAETGGKKGEKISLPAAAELADLHHAWRTSSSTEERKAIWNKILDINAQQVFSIGIVNQIPQPIIVARNLHNVPEKGIYSFEPGAFFGMYRFDLFFFSDTKTAGAN